MTGADTAVVTVRLAGIAELDNGALVSNEEAAERYDRLLKPR